ncbi:MAG: hypothetical protein QW379_06435 [Thermoplasmata archaeon]
MTSHRTYGWHASFEEFCRARPAVVRNTLREFIRDASGSQLSAWDTSIPVLQRQIRVMTETDACASGYDNILEYQLPMESRRPDVILLGNRAIVVLEDDGRIAIRVKKAGWCGKI